MLEGNLAPAGCVIKPSACDPRFLKHTGPALVFDDYPSMKKAIDDHDLEVTADHVLVLRNPDPQGGVGDAPYVKQGVRDIVRISDARMSGTSYGACIPHVAPASYVGGLLALRPVYNHRIARKAATRLRSPAKQASVFFVSGCDTSECLEVAEEVLDQMAPFVHFGVMGDAPGSVGLGGMTAAAPRSLRLARSQLLSKALSPISASKSRPVIKGSTPMLSRRWPGKSLESIFYRFGNPDCKQALVRNGDRVTLDVTARERRRTLPGLMRAS
ncbi:hypothetical protein ACVWZR_002064 [Bradyrhizobium sp. i1.3.1]